jgi:hypothetical protein
MFYYYYYHHLLLLYAGYPHTHIPETNPVLMEYIVAVILPLLFMVHLSLVLSSVVLCFYISTFRSMCAVLNELLGSGPDGRKLFMDVLKACDCFKQV